MCPVAEPYVSFFATLSNFARLVVYSNKAPVWKHKVGPVVSSE
ncbi:hypothetical protein PoMZ_11140 [Pyricularia oryzae]|uniref:Uncharacterized protein n=2 Tax=Pyricularia oryzae TaxID=318829 RepID=A0A4P7NJM2_PYROR|nr:hypothetical protein PoMZ_11140 [Pyricularia oryzae]